MQTWNVGFQNQCSQCSREKHRPTPAALDRRGNTVYLESPLTKGPTPWTGGWEGPSALCLLSPMQPRPCHTPTTKPLSRSTFSERLHPHASWALLGSVPPTWSAFPDSGCTAPSQSETPRSNFNFQILERGSSIYAVFYITHSTTSGVAPVSNTSVYLQRHGTTSVFRAFWIHMMADRAL